MKVLVIEDDRNIARGLRRQLSSEYIVELAFTAKTVLQKAAENRYSVIMHNVWESGKESWNNTIDVHIKHLRDKIDRPFEVPIIKTVYGIGYMVEDGQS